MPISEVIALILVNSSMYKNPAEARHAVIIAFKEEFPYWAFSEWNKEIPYPMARTLIEKMNNVQDLRPNDLVRNMPSLLNNLTR